MERGEPQAQAQAQAQAEAEAQAQASRARERMFTAAPAGGQSVRQPRPAPSRRHYTTQQ